MPTIYQMDFATEATYPIGTFELGLKGEVFNVTNAQKQIQASSVGYCNDATTACTALQRAYGIGTSRNAFHAPRTYRITALVRF